jgi:hypothetical protein
MQWEREARDARRGLWLSDNPKKPWEWKRDHPRNAKKQDCIQVYLIIDAANKIKPTMLELCEMSYIWVL